MAASSSQSTSNGGDTLSLRPPRGMRDFYPQDMRIRNWLFDEWRRAAQLCGFEEYDAPVVESEALYTRKAGDEICGQLYNFEDKGGRRMSLRPEITPSLARMVLARTADLPLPLKWFSIPQCFRYERTTRGRRREHFQWNADVWGVDNIRAEAELLCLATTFLSRVGFGPEDIVVRISSRAAVQEALLAAGVTESQFVPVCLQMDRLDKVPHDKIYDELIDNGLAPETARSVLDIAQIQDLDAMRSAAGAGSRAVGDLEQLFELLDDYGIKDWTSFDAGVVRGLSYYTGVVFEAHDRAGKLRAVFGGGRYDTLLTSSFGAKNAIPAVGFGFGDAVVMELLRDKGLVPEMDRGGDIVVGAYDDNMMRIAARAAAALRGQGHPVDLLFSPKKTKKILSHAARVNARVAVLAMPDEWDENGTVVVKDLEKRSQVAVPLDDLVRVVAGGSNA